MSPLPTLLWGFPAHFCLCSSHRWAVLWMWWQKTEGKFITEEDLVSSAQKLYSAPSFGQPADALLLLLLLFSRSDMSSSLWPHGILHARLPCPSLSQSLLKLMSTESVMPSNHLILSHPLLLLPSIFAPIGVFSRASGLHQVAKILEIQHLTFQWIFRIDFL